MSDTQPEDSPSPRYEPTARQQGLVALGISDRTPAVHLEGRDVGGRFLPGENNRIGVAPPNKLYSPEIVAALLARISLGEPLSKACKHKGMPSTRTVNDWINNYPEFKAEYEAARDEGADEIAMEMLEISDIVAPDRDAVAKANLQVNTRKHLLGCWHPGRYGPKVQADVTGNFNVTIGAADAKL